MIATRRARCTRRYSRAVLAPPPPAYQADLPVRPLALQAVVAETGWIRLRVQGDPGTTVTVREHVGSATAVVARIPLVTTSGGRKRAAPWRCDRLQRRFVATAPAPDGSVQTATATVRTPGCAHRLEVTTSPAHPRLGHSVAVRLRDTFRIGDLRVTVCAGPIAARATCRDVRLAPGEDDVTTSFAARTVGSWRVTASTPFGQRIARAVLVRRGGGRFVVLATGDSMIQIVDGFLKQRLGAHPGFRVESEAHISTGISKPFVLDWVAHARAQASRRHPDATVMVLGANDGYPIAGAGCCGQGWIDSYAARARRMMRAYERGGRGRVYWLLLPVPRGQSFQRVFRAVNAALRRAAAGDPSVRLIDTGRTFTPDGRFHQSIHHAGRLVSVRQPDGVHWNVAGASITADLIVGAMRRDGLL